MLAVSKFMIVTRDNRRENVCRLEQRWYDQFGDLRAVLLVESAKSR